MIKRIYTIFAVLLVALVLASCSSGSKGNNKELAVVTTPVPSESAAVSVSSTEPSTTPSTEDSSDQGSGSKGFLWKISGGKNQGYLVGTIHVTREAMYPLVPELEQAIDESDFIALELDLTKVDQMETLKLVNEKALLTDGTSLKDHVSEEDYTQFEKVMKKSLGVGVKIFDTYEPWYAAMTLEGLPAMKYMSSDGIDKYIAKKAHNSGKTVIELESMESQIGLFDGFSDELQKLYFHQTVANSKLGAIGLKQLMDMWTLGNLDLLKNMHVQYEKEGKKSMGKLFDEYNNNFLVNRNIEMVKKIDHHLADGEDGTYLVAVGSLHMVGKQGLVSLLEKKGYTVEFVK
ncbi:TraB/GumN family protein [Cohnella abietis]|uniref:Lipoprotein n=1 Tax=Cohnella abietis TaxID=2507935 RepID=A0A3T1DBF4_9BACL|nr:TraB/GumN family protein [Cohnella abietis]BBI35374.1 lipoprotein [Cohnella abietis]